MENDFLVEGEQLAMSQFVVTDDNADELSVESGGCDSYVSRLLAGWKTRPGPDEEIVVQMIARKRPKQADRPARQIRIERHQQ